MNRGRGYLKGGVLDFDVVSIGGKEGREGGREGGRNTLLGLGEGCVIKYDVQATLRY
jgi:hypothetical protein